MNDGDDEPRPKGRGNHHWTHRRSWTRRPEGALRYERYSALDAGGRPRIFFAFTPPAGQTRIGDAVYDVMNEHKHTPDGHSTGLRYSRDRIHGATWNIEDTERGRALADHIDMALQTLAARTPDERGPAR